MEEDWEIMKLNLKKNEISKLEEYFESIGFSRDNGDSVFYFARLNDSYKQD
jgi:hypothetical protein